MSNEIVEFSPVIVALHGATKTERKLSAVDVMGTVALMATMAMGGKAGKAAAEKVGGTFSVQGFAEQAAWPRNDYKDLAAFIAGQLGEDVVMGSRASYLGYVDRIEERIRTVKASKSGGMRTTAQGVQEPNAAHKTLLAIRQLLVEVHAAERELSTQRRAEAAAQKAAEQLPAPAAE